MGNILVIQLIFDTLKIIKGKMFGIVDLISTLRKFQHLQKVCTIVTLKARLKLIVQIGRIHKEVNTNMC